MKYQKKPIIIDAFKFVDGFFIDKKITQEFKDACCRKNDTGTTFERTHIHTLEGIHWITVGDWIIKGVAGEFYPCKPDIFAMTYEKVKEE